MATLFFAAVVLSPAIRGVLRFVSFWAVKEYITLLKTRPADHGGLVLMFLSIPIQYYWVANGWYGMFIIFIPVYNFPVFAYAAGDGRRDHGLSAAASQIQWGLMAFVFGLSHLGVLAPTPVKAGHCGERPDACALLGICD